MPVGHVHVYHVYLGPETGLWCETCLLPSLVRVRAFLLYDSPLMVSFHGTAEYCAEHDEEARWTRGR